MEALYEELAREGYLPIQVLLARLLLAIACGAAAGSERERQGHAAGLRTHIMISLTSAVIALVGIEISHVKAFDQDVVRIDPTRLIEAVTSGVAFLAAGMIVFTRGEIKGLTTGSGMWAAGAIGLSCGLGLWRIALLATLGTVIVLALLRRLERYIDTKNGDQGQAPPDPRQ